jgi:hypothetical protein
MRTKLKFLEQLENVLSPIEVTESGIVAEVRLEQPENAFIPMETIKERELSFS